MAVGDEIRITNRRLLTRLLLATLAAFGFTTSSAAPTQISAEEILRRADAVRFPQEAFEVGVDIRTTVDGKPTGQGVYKVLSKGNENSLVLTLEPASERGQILLM